MGKPLRRLKSPVGPRHGRVSALMIAIKVQAVGDDDSNTRWRSDALVTDFFVSLAKRGSILHSLFERSCDKRAS